MGFGGGGTGSGASTIVPVGAVMEYAGAGDPAGWLICDGRSLTEVAQPNLFAVIGTTYGGGGGSFNIPDFQTANRFARGATNDAARGTTGGSRTITIANMPAHTHNIARLSGVPLTVTFTINSHTTDSGIDAVTKSTGGGTDYNPPFLDLHYIIKV